jgi:general secretion pathway protein F
VPRFTYKALSASGETLEGEMEAPTRTAVIEQLQRSGHLPVAADALDGKRRRRLPFEARRAVTARDAAILTRELATLLHAGVPLDAALGMLAETAPSPPAQQMLGRIRAGVQAGATLSDALGRDGEAFDRLYVNMVRAGEAAGALEQTLARIADHQDRARELRESITSALIYPLILVLVASASLVLLVMFVIPRFTPLFDDMGETLPLLTQIVIAIAETLRGYWWLILGALAASVWFVRAQLANPATRYRWDGWFLRVPLIADLIVKLEIARLSRTLGLMLRNGVPLLTAVAIVRDTMHNRVLARAMGDVEASLERGRGLARPIAASGRFPKLAVQLIQVGEETGQLEDLLDKLAGIYDAEVRAAIKRLLAVLEPALILGMGIVIGLIIVSILLAILGLNELVV